MSNIKPINPYYLVKVVKGVDNKNQQVVKDNIYMNVNNRVQGQYMSICRVLSSPNGLTDLTGEYVLVWSTAVKPFLLPDTDITINLVKKEDIYAIMTLEFLKKTYPDEFY